MAAHDRFLVRGRAEPARAAVLDQRWNGEITMQIAGGDIEQVSSFTGVSKL